jgi:glycosyltransferase involved in cell wall biosynthesis
MKGRPLGSSLLIDIRPEAGGHGQRGIGRYVRGLITSINSFPEDLRRRIWAFGEVGGALATFGTHGLKSSAAGRTGPIPGWVRGRLATRAALSESGASFLHATDPHQPWTGRVPAVVTVYDLILLHEPAMLQSLRPDHRYMYRWYLRQIRSADRVITISQATATDVEERLGILSSRIDVVYPAVAPPPGFTRREAALEPAFLVVGALDPHKQPELALEAFAAYRRRAGSGTLRFVGPATPHRRAMLLKKAAHLGVGGAVSIDGRIADDELERAYGSATALLSASRVEGFGLPPVEAILRGVPVIAVDTVAARETLGGAALLVPMDASAIAAAMARLIDPPASAVAAIRERFAIASVARSLEDSYRRVID